MHYSNSTDQHKFRPSFNTNKTTQLGSAHHKIKRNRFRSAIKQRPELKKTQKYHQKKKMVNVTKIKFGSAPVTNLNSCTIGDTKKIKKIPH